MRYGIRDTRGLCGTLVCLTFLMGCAKVEPECELVLSPKLLVAAGSDQDTPASGTRAYAFYIEGRDADDPATREWAPADWDDASEGMVRNARTGEVRNFNLVAEQTGVDDISMVVSRSPVLVVVVEPGGEMWARRVVDYRVPMASLTLKLRFERQKPTPYTDLEWEVEK